MVQRLGDPHPRCSALCQQSLALHPRERSGVCRLSMTRGHTGWAGGGVERLQLAGSKRTTVTLEDKLVSYEVTPPTAGGPSNPTSRVLTSENTSGKTCSGSSIHSGPNRGQVQSPSAGGRGGNEAQKPGVAQVQLAGRRICCGTLFPMSLGSSQLRANGGG